MAGIELREITILGTTLTWTPDDGWQLKGAKPNQQQEGDSHMGRMPTLVLLPADFYLLHSERDAQNRELNTQERIDDALESAINAAMARFDRNAPRPHRELIDGDEVEDRRDAYERGYEDGPLKFSKMNPDWNKNLVAAQAFARYYDPKAVTTEGKRGVDHHCDENHDGVYDGWEIGGQHRGLLAGGTKTDKDLRLLWPGKDRGMGGVDADVIRVDELNFHNVEVYTNTYYSGHHTTLVIDARNRDDITITVPDDFDLDNNRYRTGAKEKWLKRFDEIIAKVRKETPEAYCAIVTVNREV